MYLDLEGVKAVVFDLDGTLFDKSRLPFYLVCADPLYMFVLNNERKARKTLAGVHFGDERTYYETLYGKVAILSHISAKRVKWWYDHRYMPTMTKVLHRHYRLRPWVSELLPDLKRKGIKVAVYSDYGCVEQRLEALGFNSDWADVITDAPRLGGLKPSKDSLLALCNLLQVSPAESLMVGDKDETDGESARLCGMRFHLVQ
ncbi:MAG: HAD family hydrolase [Bacteroidales bacterium]|nr:HAD family hydrolase [Bacteroidales bacterium]